MAERRRKTMTTSFVSGTAARYGKTLALALLAGGCAGPWSEVQPSAAPAQVAAPTVAVGDTWTYRVTDGFTHLPRADQQLQVRSVSGDRIEVAGDVERGDGTLVFDREWN